MRGVFTALVAISVIALLAPEAAGQCTMTHTAVSGGYQLCAVGGTAWVWNGPAGFYSNSACVTVNTTGTYTLMVFDGLNGLWSAPCSFDVTALPTDQVCAITGRDSVCAGSSTSWCGPTGDFLYAWTGPGDFTAGTACVGVSVAGDYTVTVLDNVTGVSSGPCTRTLVVTTCTSPHSANVCPASARAWARSCGGPGSMVDATTFARIAQLVDDRSSVWAYNGSSDGLCALLRRRRELDWTDAAAAKRQYAAVLANLSAAEIGATAADGHAIGLDGAKPLALLHGVPSGMTIADWVSSTEARFLALASGPVRSRSAREEYRRIAAQGREIDRGTGACAGLANAWHDDEDVGSEPGGGSLVSTLAAAGIDPPRPGPGASGSRMSWTLLNAASVELTVMDITGRRVRHLASGVYGAGTHEFTWDGRDDDGRAMRTGAYFVAGTVGGERLTQRIFILR